MSYNSSATTTLALASTALALSAASSANASASRERSRYNNALNAEYDSLTSTIEKMKEFREAASEMLGTIEDKISLKHITDLKDIKVPSGLLYLFKTDVPAETMRWANEEARKIVGEDIKAVIDDMKGDFKRLAQYGVMEDPDTDENIYTHFRAVEFLEEMRAQAGVPDMDGIRDIGRNGAALSLQDTMLIDIEPKWGGVSPHAESYAETRTPLEKKALSATIKHFSEAVSNEIGKLREPVIQRIVDRSPAYEAA